MTANNSMKKKAGRPKGDAKKGSIPRPAIGGMNTLGPLPVYGVKKKGAKK